MSLSSSSTERTELEHQGQGPGDQGPQDPLQVPQDPLEPQNEVQEPDLLLNTYTDHLVNLDGTSDIHLGSPHQFSSTDNVPRPTVNTTFLNQTSNTSQLLIQNDNFTPILP